MEIGKNRKREKRDRMRTEGKRRVVENRTKKKEGERRTGQAKERE